MTTISRKCPECKVEKSVEFEASEKATAQAMQKAEKKLDEIIQNCEHYASTERKPVRQRKQRRGADEV